MVSQMLTLNILLVPIITVFLINKSNAKSIKFNLHILAQYVISAVLNVSASKGVIVFLRFFNGESNVLLDSGYYTIIAAVVAVILGIIYILYKKYINLKIEVSSDESENSEESKK